MIKKLLPVTILIVFAVIRSALPASASPLVSLASPESAWSGSYLVNYAFLAEYSLLWKGDQPVDSDLMSLKSGRALWIRAYFAIEAMRVRSQDFSEHQKIDQRLDQHFLLLQKSSPGIVKERDQIRKAAAMHPEAQDQAAAEEGFALVEQSLSDVGRQQHFGELRNLYFADVPSCPISAADVKDFVLHQKTLLQEKKAINGSQLIGPVKDWSLKKVRCLVFALMATPAASKALEGTDPLPLMLTFQQMGSPLTKDMSYKSVYAIRLLQTEQFAETLRSLFELVDLQPAFRLPYEIVQRIFSIRQKGDGQVALKGI